MNTILPKYDIVTPKRLAAFLAQTAHESAGFTAVRENLNYSAQGLMNTWPARFNQTTAAAYARQPEKIANKVYANRMGNGDEASGDGWRYRGRGLIQTTGKANYTKLAQHIKRSLEETIQYCETVEGAVESACFYWASNNLNAIADTGDMATLTRRINGGLIGLADRVDKYKKVLALLEKSNAKAG
jgi:putative chitinase